MLTPEEHQAVARLINYLRREGHDSDIALIRKLITKHDLMAKVLADLHNTHRHVFRNQIETAVDNMFQTMGLPILKALRGDTNET